MVKKYGCIVVMIVLLVFSLVSTVGAQQQFISIATGSTGGTFYPVGVIFSTSFSEELRDSGYRFSAHATGGTAENLEMIRNREVTLAISGSVPAAQAYMGIEMYEDKAIENIRFVTALWPEAVQLMYRVGVGIETLEDFAGKRIGVGPPGGGGSIYMPVILGAVAGMTFADFSPQYMGYGDSVQAVQNRLMDACYLAAGVPTASVSQLYAGQVGVGMIEFTDEELAKIQEEAPYFIRVVIPPDTYPRQEESVYTIGIKSSMVAEASVSDEIIYQMLDVIYNKRLEEIRQQHGALRDLRLESAIDGLSGAPLHPGAVKFYRDHGIDVPEDLLPPEM